MLSWSPLTCSAGTSAWELLSTVSSGLCGKALAESSYLEHLHKGSGVQALQCTSMRLVLRRDCNRLFGYNYSLRTFWCIIDQAHHALHFMNCWLATHRPLKLRQCGGAAFCSAYINMDHYVHKCCVLYAVLSCSARHYCMHTLLSSIDDCHDRPDRSWLVRLVC